MEWSSAFAPALVALSALIIPGFLVTVAAGQRGINALGLSAPISAAVIGVSAIVSAKLGIAWSIWVPLLSGLLLSLLVYALTTAIQHTYLWDTPWLLGRNRTNVSSRLERGKGSIASGTYSPLKKQKWWMSQDGWYYLAFAISGILLLRNITEILGRPQAVGQSFDEIFHLNAVRYIDETKNASSLDLLTMTNTDGSPSSFYPAVWHAIVSLGFGSTDVSVPESVNAMVLVISAFIWPLSLLYMLRNLVKLNNFSLLFSGAAAASFVAFPYLLLRWGILYPNALGLAMVPVGVSIVSQILRVVPERSLAAAPGLFLGALAMLGIGFAHPNAAISVLLFSIPIIAVRIGLEARGLLNRRALDIIPCLYILALLLVLGCIGVIWRFVRPAIEAGKHWVPDLELSEAVGQSLLNDAMNVGPLWAVSIMVFFGVAAILIRRDRTVWLAFLWGIVIFFSVAARAFDYSEGRYEILGIWYQDSYRVMAFVPMVMVPLVAVGANAIYVLIYKLLNKFDMSSSVLPSVLMIAISTPLVISMQLNQSFDSYIESSKNYYNIEFNGRRISSDELKVFEYIENNLEKDVKIVVDPENGGASAYAYTGRPVTAYHIYSSKSENEIFLSQHFDEAGITPGVCEVIAEENAYYALGFDVRPNRYNTYPGVRELAENPGITEVYREGGAALYRADVCLSQ